MQSFKFHFICPFHDFGAQLELLSISPLVSHSLSPNYRTKQNYFDLYARRQSPQSAPALARAVFLVFFFFFRFFYCFSTVNRFGGPTKCFDSAGTAPTFPLSVNKTRRKRIWNANLIWDATVACFLALTHVGSATLATTWPARHINCPHSEEQLRQPEVLSRKRAFCLLILRQISNNFGFEFEFGFGFTFRFEPCA